MEELKLPRSLDGTAPQKADVSNGGIRSETGRDEEASQESARATDACLAGNGHGMTEGALCDDESKKLLKLLGCGSCAIGEREKVERKARR
jgi:hypothetical protein